MSLEAVTQEILRGLVTLLAGLIVARAGLFLYFRQKEYEIVKQRYLEQAVDVVASELESVGNIFSHNWARSLQVLKLYRDNREHFEEAELKTGFIPLNAAYFHRAAHHRLSSLIRSNLLWEIYQLALAKFSDINSKAAIEVPEAIRLHIAGQLDVTLEEFIEISFEELRPLSDQADKYAKLASALQTISSELERTKLSFKRLSAFSRKKIIVSALENLRLSFLDELNMSEKTMDFLSRKASNNKDC